MLTNFNRHAQLMHIHYLALNCHSSSLPRYFMLSATECPSCHHPAISSLNLTRRLLLVIRHKQVHFSSWHALQHLKLLSHGRSKLVDSLLFSGQFPLFSFLLFLSHSFPVKAALSKFALKEYDSPLSAFESLALFGTAIKCLNDSSCSGQSLQRQTRIFVSLRTRAPYMQCSIGQYCPKKSASKWLYAQTRKQCCFTPLNVFQAMAPFQILSVEVEITRADFRTPSVSNVFSKWILLSSTVVSKSLHCTSKEWNVLQDICTICSACAREPASSNATSLLTSLSNPFVFHLLRYVFKPLQTKCWAWTTKWEIQLNDNYV